MNNIIIFDFEVFKYDVLLGTKILGENNTSKTIQIWTPEKIKDFYKQHSDDIWVGHNNGAYDNLILQACVDGTDPYQMSKTIINSRFKPYCKLHLYWFDLMASQNFPYSLKATELTAGQDISETEVDFNLDRPLTEEEKLKTESYNRDDLNRTEANFYELIAKFRLRLDIINEFNLSLDCLNVTGTKLAAIVLGAHHIDGIEYQYIKPHLYPNLELKNEALKQFYMSEDFRKDKKLTISVCGCEHQIGQGGAHAALTKYHTSRALYFDVSGYYNLTMINYDLLPRTLGPEGKERYVSMYHEQLRLKALHSDKRGAYKTILLSVFGAMLNKYTDFYDPQKGLLVTITGQLFIIDLLEHLEKYVKVIQTNTDGIIVEPFDWANKDKIISIVEEWEKRTGYVIKKEEIYDLWQRDVNCYIYRQADGKWHKVGQVVNQYDLIDWPIWGKQFNAKDPLIISIAVVDYFSKGVKPEDTIKKYQDTPRYFELVCKKTSFQWTELQENFKDGTAKITKLQGVNRAFASNNKDVQGVVYKCRTYGKVRRARVANLPDNVFIYDGEILSDKAKNELRQKIDYSWYVNEATRFIKTFFRIPQIKLLDLSKGG